MSVAKHHFFREWTLTCFFRERVYTWHREGKKRRWLLVVLFCVERRGWGEEEIRIRVFSSICELWPTPSFLKFYSSLLYSSIPGLFSSVVLLSTHHKKSKYVFNALEKVGGERWGGAGGYVSHCRASRDQRLGYPSTLSSLFLLPPTPPPPPSAIPQVSPSSDSVQESWATCLVPLADPLQACRWKIPLRCYISCLSTIISISHPLFSSPQISLTICWNLSSALLFIKIYSLSLVLAFAKTKFQTPISTRFLSSKPVYDQWAGDQISYHHIKWG